MTNLILQEVFYKKEGVLLVDKPNGMTSHAVVNRVRRLTGISRVGHAGTLDPLATGLLIILVGRRYTKQQDFFLKKDKTYLCRARFGMATDTYDRDGQVVQTTDWSVVERLTKHQLDRALSNFRGSIDQVVPPFSAVKRKGQKLYELARQNKLDKTQLPSRRVHIIDLKLVEFDKDDYRQVIEATLKITCSSGTYIRSLVHDCGQVLGLGAVVMTLRRTRIGPWSIKQASLCPV